MQSLVSVAACFFKSYRRKTFGVSARIPPSLGKGRVKRIMGFYVKAYFSNFSHTSVFVISKSWMIDFLKVPSAIMDVILSSPFTKSYLYLIYISWISRHSFSQVPFIVNSLSQIYNLKSTGMAFHLSI